ncbi:hypothetical protein CDAR_448651 [Caerostris darwini]|uniref:Uncharacterized protein n=1 Tax=Caerostris darwini TaxID=1538125 RepID=A0AAV4QQY4_9ARAC|nr:hypothetical protein CDAR_448651 [Caerostris darwini]
MLSDNRHQNGTVCKRYGFNTAIGNRLASDALPDPAAIRSVECEDRMHTLNETAPLEGIGTPQKDPLSCPRISFSAMEIMRGVSVCRGDF